MSERYSTLFSLKETNCAKDCPVLLSAASLLKDNQTGKILAQLKFKNADQKKINVVKATICCFDAKGAPLSCQNALYQDLNAPCGSFFGQKNPVFLQNSETRSFSVKIDEVIFEDKTFLTFEGLCLLPFPAAVPFEQTEGANRKLLEQYQRSFGKNARYAFLEQDGLWRCACGEVNGKNEECTACGVHFGALSTLTVPSLQAELDAFLDMKNKEMQAQLAREQEELRKKKKTKKKLTVVISTIAALILLLLLTIFVIVPFVRLNQATTLMEKGQYEQAESILKDLNGFAASEEKLAIIDAIDNLKKEDFDGAINKIVDAGASINVNYELNGGTCETGSSSTYSPSSPYSALSTPQKTGYRFVKWTLDSYSYSKKSSLTLVLDSVWTGGYLISYELDGGTAENPEAYEKDGDAVTLNAPTKKGYDFVGWTGTDLSEPTKKVTIPAGSYGDRTYTANWKASTYTVTLNANGGKTKQPSLTATYNQYLKLPTPTRDHYEFEGWYDGTTKLQNGTWNKTTDLALTAKWTPITYTVSYDLDKGQNSSGNPKSYTFESSDLTLQDATRRGYKFMGWYTDEKYTGQIKEISEGSFGNLKLHAKWEIITYTITYHTNGGSISNGNTTKYTINDIPLTLPTASKAGYTFADWKVGDKDGDPITKITECKDLTLYATFADSNLKLQYHNSYYAVTDYTGSAATIEIPTSYNGYPVTEIGDDAFENCLTLQSIVIPEGVTTIGNNCFKGCSSLTSITLPSTLKEIYYRAFANCTALKSIVIPESVTSIGLWAFNTCSRLTDIWCEAAKAPSGDVVWYNFEYSTVHLGGSWKYVNGVPTLK